MNADASPSPTFIIAGAQKCGTTWLSAMVRQHPDVFMSERKELHFFDKPHNYAKGLHWYQAQFDGRAGERAVGEATPNYFWTGAEGKGMGGVHTDIPVLIKSAFPQVKIVLALRNPTKRAISAFYHHIGRRRVSPSARLIDVIDKHGIMTMGFYDVHLGRYQTCFREDQLLVLFFEEDIIVNKKRTMARVFEFLGVDPCFVPTEMDRRRTSRRNHLAMRLKPISARLGQYAKRYAPPQIDSVPGVHIPVHDYEKEALDDLFRPHNVRLASMLDRPLPSGWPT